MEDQCSPLSWGYCQEEGSMEELRQSLLYTTLELETTILSAKEEITRREVELIHVKEVLAMTIKEKEEAQERCQRLIMEKLMLQQQLQQQQRQRQQEQEPAVLPGTSGSEDDESKAGIPTRSLYSSECQLKMVAAPAPSESIPQPQLSSSLYEEALKLAKKPLPEKGKLLQAVMAAGPLLQTVLLAGPLPQWQHPPPQLDSNEIPPVAISSPAPPSLIRQTSFNNLNGGCLAKKRSLELCEGPDSSPDSKHRKVFLH